MTRISMASKGAQRWTAEQEQNTARAIRSAEWQIRELLADYDVAQVILCSRPVRQERTKAGAIDRLESAIKACEAEVSRSTDTEFVGHVRRARALWMHAEDLRWQLAMSAKRIAYGEARKFTSPYMDQEDLVQEGLIGLLRAARRFDPDRGIRFSTYARWWVRANMTHAINEGGRPIRLPGGAIEQANHLRKAAKQFDQLGFEYTISDLAEEAGIDQARAELLLLHSGDVVCSLDDPMRDGKTVADTVPGTGRFSQPDEAAAILEYVEQMKIVLAKLTERQRTVIQEHYGLGDAEEHTLAQIGRNLGVCRERVRQIEILALQHFREEMNE